MTIVHNLFFGITFCVWLIFFVFSGAPCPSGWTRFNRYCYLVRSYIRTWHQAQAFCKARKGELVKITNAEENEFVLALARKHAPSRKQVWIGLKRYWQTNQFVWSDQSVPVYTNWAPHEPNNFQNSRENFGSMWTGHSSSLLKASGLWNDFPSTPPQHLPCGIVCKMLP